MRFFILIISLVAFSAQAQMQLLLNSVGAVGMASGVSWQAETLSYSNTIATNGGTITLSDVQAVNAFVNSAKANGYWTYILDCSPFAGGNTNAAVVKLKAGGASKIVYAKGMASTDWTHAGGWANRGGAKMLDLMYTNVGWEGSNGMSAWITYPTTNLGPGQSTYLMGHTSGSSEANFLLSIQGSGSVGFSQSAYSLASLTPANPPAWTPGSGLYGFTRTATNWMGIYQNGQFEQVRTNADSPGANTFKSSIGLLGAVNPFGGYQSVYMTNVPVGWYAVDSGIPTNLIATYSADVTTLMRGLGRGSDWQTNTPLKAVLIAGQSLGAGGGSGTRSSSPVLTNQTPWTLFSGGDPLPALNANSRIAARATLAGWTEAGSETGWQAFGTHLHYLLTNSGYAGDPVCLFPWAKSGESYLTLKKGSQTNYLWTNAVGVLQTNVYALSMADLAQTVQTVSNLYGMKLNVVGVIVAHGEADRLNTNYGANLLEWGQNYAADIMSTTGQTNSPKMYSFQESSFYYPYSAGAYPYSGISMLANTESYPATNRLVGPRYQMLHQSDNVHLYNTSYLWQGEYAAEALFNDVWLGVETSLRPTNITRSGAAITLTYNRTGLALDTNLVNFIQDYGFRYTNASAQTNISTVVVSGATSNQVVVTLASDPGAVAGTLTYALNNTNGSPGPLTGARGNVRDSYSHVGTTTANPLFNWSVYFSKTVN